MNRHVSSILICLLLLLFCSPLFAATYIEAPEGDIIKEQTESGKPSIGSLYMSIDMEALPQAVEVGFSSTDVSGFNNVDTPLDAVSLTTPITNGCFSNNATDTEVYLYWQILSAKQPAPKVSLTIIDAMKNSGIADSSLNWKVSWTAKDGKKYQIASDASAAAKSDIIIGPAEDDVLLKMKSGAVKLMIETITPYWTVPAAVYSADLKVEITGV